MMASTINRGATWTNLLHWYSFDEAEGNLIDLHGTDDGVLTGCTQGSTGKINDAYTFNGSSDLITLGTGIVVGWNDFTFAGWIYPTDASGGIIGGTEGAFEITLYPDYHPRVMLAGGAGTDVPLLTLNANEWNFLTVSRDNPNIRYGVNGSYETEVFDTLFDGTTNEIGGTVSVYGWLAGMFDEFAYFSDAKSDEYLTAMYNSGNGKAYSDGE